MKFIARRCLAVPLWPALALAVVFALTVVTTQSAQAQTFSVIHNFSGQDGAAPIAGVTMDKAGSLYGTASSGGDYGVGIAFRLSHKGSGWVFTPLYSFQGNDGVSPQARVIFGPNGGLYGTTTAGGNGSGTVFELTPYPTACKSALCGWNETVLYRFTGGSDGAVPGYGDLAFDQAGNLYGTTEVGGGSGCTHHNGCGTVYKLTPSNGGWAESVLYSFQEEVTETCPLPA